MTSQVAFVDDQGRQSVLKCCRDRRYIDWLRREHDVLTALSESPLRIPRVLGYREVCANGQSIETWLLMTRLSGEPLWDVLLRSAPFERSQHFRRLGHLLRELRSTPAPRAFHDQRPWIDRMLQEARNNLP
jgi:aminoglycoside phosphotransferase (APT) family kinase protein